MPSGLRILFDPAIDRGAYLGASVPAATVAEAALGPLGLLDRLETELGLGGLHPSAADRAAALSAHLRDRSGWWRASYDADPSDTCQRLLRDRDTLMLWGWSGEPASPRLAELWTATHAAAPGVPDRLRAVQDALAAGRKVDVDLITVMSPLALPPAWRTVFAALGAAGVAVTELEPTKAAPTGDLARARTAPFVPTGDGSLPFSDRRARWPSLTRSPPAWRRCRRWTVCSWLARTRSWARPARRASRRRDCPGARVRRARPAGPGGRVRADGALRPPCASLPRSGPRAAARRRPPDAIRTP